MNEKIKILTNEIDSLKKTLYVLMDGKKLTDSNVVECSQRLDRLIVEFQRYQNSIQLTSPYKLLSFYN